LFFVVFMATVVGAALSFVLFVWRMALALALSKAHSGWTVRKVVLYGLVSLPLLPAATFLLYWGLSIDLPTSVSTLHVAGCLAPAFPVMLIVMARLIVKERRYEEAWTSLEIGE
jgi:hypothetical protein